MRSAWDRRIRVLACPACAAPCDVAVGGGKETCRACGHAADYAAVDVAAELAPNRPRPLDPAVRLEALRGQDGAALVPPTGVASFQRATPDDLLHAWNDTLLRIERGASFSERENLYFLALFAFKALRGTGRDRELRCVLETTLDRVSASPRYAHMLRGLLARAAVHANDLPSAEEWAAALDPASDDLYVDSAYVITRSVICTAKRDWGGVLRLLGNGLDDHPTADAYDELAGLLRSNALERSGRLEDAVTQLAASMSRDFSAKLVTKQTRVANPELDLCPQSFDLAWKRARMPRAGCFGLLMSSLLAVSSLGGFAVIPVMVCASGVFLKACAPVPYAQGLATVEACPLTAEALGDDIGATVGVGCGGYEGGGGSADLDWGVPISGSRARGTMQLTATQRGGQWTLHVVDVTVRGTTIDALTCTPR